MILVLGSGFGLYGHLAALALEDAPVATLARYREVAERRGELAPLLDRVAWLDDEAEALAEAELTCLVRRPADNAALAEQLCATGAGGLLVIEKPIAPAPAEAERLAEQLGRCARPWAVPYLFLHTEWYPAIVDRLRQGRSVTIDWSHRQSPLAKGWKQRGGEGGGALAFYFVHALALVEAALPGCSVRLVSEPGDAGAIRIEADVGGPSLGIALTLGSAIAFEVGAEGETLFAAASPFGPIPGPGVPDPRIPPLRHFYRSLRTGGGQTAEFHAAVTRHWRRLAEAGV